MSESERTETQHDDIWVKGIKTIVGHHKKSLLDYADALDKNPAPLGSMKAKIHNDLSQIQLSIGILFETFRSGGSIKPFSDSFHKTNKAPYARKPDVHQNRKSEAQPVGKS